jgi:hypothetical protein
VTVSVKVKNEQQLASAAVSPAARAAARGVGSRARRSRVGAMRSAPRTVSAKNPAKSATRSGLSALGSVQLSGTHPRPSIVSSPIAPHLSMTVYGIPCTKR